MQLQSIASYVDKFGVEWSLSYVQESKTLQMTARNLGPNVVYIFRNPAAYQVDVYSESVMISEWQKFREKKEIRPVLPDDWVLLWSHDAISFDLLIANRKGQIALPKSWIAKVNYWPFTKGRLSSSFTPPPRLQTIRNYSFPERSLVFKNPAKTSSR